jgi:integrase
LNQSVPYQRPIIQTALNTAFSVIDILKLTWAQINFDRRTITLARTKTDVPMLQPMTDELVRVLQSLPRHPTSPYVFCNEEGEPYKRIIKGFKAACKRAGIHDFRFHDLRHTFASQYLMNGGDLQTLKVLMGHKSIITTSKYAHFVQKHLANEIKRLDNLFGGK